MKTYDGCAVDLVVRFPRPSPSTFAHSKLSKTRGVEGLRTRQWIAYRRMCESGIGVGDSVRTGWVSNDNTTLKLVALVQLAGRADASFRMLPQVLLSPSGYLSSL